MFWSISLICLSWIELKHIYQYNRHSTLMTAYRHLKDPKFKYYVIREKGQVYHALKHFFRKEEAV